MGALVESPMLRGGALALPDSPRERGPGTLVESPRARGALLALPDPPQDAPEVGSPRRHGTAAAAAPCTPPQSPDRSELELTPGPLSADECDPSNPGDYEEPSSECHRVETSSTPAAKVLFIDAIAHCIGQYSRRSWAPVASAAALSVRGVLCVGQLIWHTAYDILYYTSQPWCPQLAPYLSPHPDEHFQHARQELVALKQLATQSQQPRDLLAMAWCKRWYCRIDMVVSIYESVWQQYHQLASEAAGLQLHYMAVDNTLQSVLRQRDVRLGLAEPETSDDHW
eukprot:TRINITY_DN4454_c0_g2_i1.p1 TRINITY_DN4454_c0_g2~~TRINITY_DN4454_c0_g2_i1.p1  ORF type:complete len:321 (+),score=30.78 TRINITY_DN4454_c0_g2_i1:117-965(+)